MSNIDKPGSSEEIRKQEALTAVVKASLDLSEIQIDQRITGRQDEEEAAEYKRLYDEAKQACLDLGLTETEIVAFALTEHEKRKLEREREAREWEEANPGQAAALKKAYQRTSLSMLKEAAANLKRVSELGEASASSDATRQKMQAELDRVRARCLDADISEDEIEKVLAES